MKQLLQNLNTGATEIVELPAPACGRGRLLIRTARTLVSAGTERTLVDFGKAGWIEKARQQPEKVRQVLDKIRTDGLIPTAEAVFNKLDEPMPLGYCNAGVVIEIGEGLRQAQPALQMGDRVASNGPHAEIVCVPRNLCATIPDGVSDDEAAFTVLGAIALQGVRLAVPTFGERFLVFGLGLVGLLTVQFLRASGCAVLAVDVSETRLRLAEGFGAETVDLSKGTNPVAAARAWTSGRGVDGALIAASAQGDDIVHQAAQACRKRGRIVLVGVVDLHLRRSDFYEKELTFQVSCSYGPGRYDERYEQGGQDYPLGFVRWTEQRNFEAVLEAMRTGQLRVQELITHRLSLDEAAAGYDKALHDPAALGILIAYPGGMGDSPGSGDSPIFRFAKKKDSPSEFGRGESPTVSLTYHFPCRGNGAVPHLRAGSHAQDEEKGAAPPFRGGERNADAVSPTVGVIGAGNYARSILLPALSRTPAKLAAIADINGVAAAHAARKFGAGKAVSDYRQVLEDPEIQAVFVLVGHHLHAPFVCEALEAGKHVFVEKPLAINEAQLERIGTMFGGQSPFFAARKKGQSPEPGGGAPDPHSPPFPPMVMVGFNRRFSPHAVKIKELLAGRAEPLTMTMTVNAGFIPPEHWTQDPERGGGRIVGEGCHFIDLLSFFADSPVASVSAMMVGGGGPVREDKMTILLGFADGSVGTVHYFANGAKSYPKEGLEIFGGGRVICMENFRITRGYGFKGFRSFRTWRQDKGHRAEIAAFVRAVAAGGPPLIPFDRIVNVTRASFAAVESARTDSVVHRCRNSRPCIGQHRNRG